ncbi:MAG: tryptophan synthase subunit alpha [Myxococcales bacterium]|nr:tryptophan synthase subunit alpha [Myxococcales bacterium]
MGRIQDAFDRADREGRAALVIYLCAGDPGLDTTVELVVAAAEAGADIIELGVPFSDPTADGPAIQRAAGRALSSGTTLAGVLGAVRAIRARVETPIVLFGYYNPVLRYGETRLAERAAAAGVDGLLVVDLPADACGPLRDAAIANGLDYVPLLAPTSDASRVALAGRVATAFVYYVSMTGVTGTKVHDLEAAAARAGTLQHTLGLPLALGFGIQTREDVAAAARHVRGVVVGSAVVRAIEQAGSPAGAVAAVRTLVRDLAAGTAR